MWFSLEITLGRLRHMIFYSMCFMRYLLAFYYAFVMYVMQMNIIVVLKNAGKETMGRKYILQITIKQMLSVRL